MAKRKKTPKKSVNKELFTLILKYWKLSGLLFVFAIGTNILGLAIPRLTGNLIDEYNIANDLPSEPLLVFGLVIASVLILNSLQAFVSIIFSEKVAKDLRNRLANKVSRQSFSYVIKTETSQLLTNFTSDVDAVKEIVSKGAVNIISAIILLFGSIFLLLTTNLKLGLIVLTVIPFIAISFFLVFSRIRKLFKESQENKDALNKVINETILGAALIRILSSQSSESSKFLPLNDISKDLGLRILRMFGSLIPIITLLSNIAVLLIVWFGGNQVINSELTIGEFTAFYSYMALLITPIFIIGFISQALARAFASYARISKVLNSRVSRSDTGEKVELTGSVKFKNISLTLNKKELLKGISFDIKKGTKNAIIGPTASGKTQLIYLVSGLIDASEGRILFNDKEIDKLNKDNIFEQIGLVFQDNIIFDGSLQENLIFKDEIDTESLGNAISTAELDELIESLPKGINTKISERGSNLSGGQKQRIGLARALAQDPKVLILDDFTARVDIKTEKQILKNIEQNYPDLTLIVVSQKISSVKDFDQILLLMEGELVAKGKHKELIKDSLEYKQIFESQKSAN